MADHTSGPWAIDPERPAYASGAVLGYYLHAPLDGGGRIGQVFENCLVTTREEAEANARLIAAAPDMLHALRVAVMALANAHSRDAAYDVVDRAIRRATEGNQQECSQK